MVCPPVKELDADYDDVYESQKRRKNPKCRKKRKRLNCQPKGGDDYRKQALAINKCPVVTFTP
jgi:hypothetical protein